jgi:hypothetical protein
MTLHPRRLLARFGLNTSTTQSLSLRQGKALDAASYTQVVQTYASRWSSEIRTHSA